MPTTACHCRKINFNSLEEGLSAIHPNVFTKLKKMKFNKFLM